MGDIILDDDNNVIVKGNLRADSGAEITSAGSSAGFAFTERGKDNERWVWYAQDGSARLYLDGVGDIFSVSNEGTVSTVGENNGYSYHDRATDESWTWLASLGFSVLAHSKLGNLLRIGTATEVESLGPASGFAIHDRTTTSDRWVWYADKGYAHLSTGSGIDLLTISYDGKPSLSHNGDRTMKLSGSFEANTVLANSFLFPAPADYPMPSAASPPSASTGRGISEAHGAGLGTMTASGTGLKLTDTGAGPMVTETPASKIPFNMPVLPLNVVSELAWLRSRLFALEAEVAALKK